MKRSVIRERQPHGRILMSVFLVLVMLMTLAPNVLAENSAVSMYGEYVLETEHIKFTLSNEEYGDEIGHADYLGWGDFLTAEVISPGQFADWLSRLDIVYWLYVDLVGYPPVNGEQLIIEIENDKSSEDYYASAWAWIGTKNMGWAGNYVREQLTDIASTGECNYLIMHELGHIFDCYFGGIFHAEFTADLKILYALEHNPDLMILQGSHEIRGTDYRESWYQDAMKIYDNGQGADNLFAAMTDDNVTNYDHLWFYFHPIVEEYGWGIFEQSYRSYMDGSYPAEISEYTYGGEDAAVKLAEWLDRLAYFASLEKGTQEELDLEYGGIYEGGLLEERASSDHLLQLSADGGAILRQLYPVELVPKTTLNAYDLSDKTVTYFEVPDFIETVESYTFANFAQLKTVVFPENVTSIGSYLFNDCPALEQVYIYNRDAVLSSTFDRWIDGEAVAPQITVYGYTGSTAQAWVEAYGDRAYTNVTFVALDADSSGDSGGGSGDNGGGSSGGGSSGGGNSGGSSESTTYTVRFESNGGSGVSSQSIAQNGTLTAPTAPTRQGYIFTGWYIDEALTTAYDFSRPVTESFTLYARWEAAEKEKEEEYAHPAYINGYGDGTFRPENSMTRAEAATLFYNLRGRAQSGGFEESGFSDVPTDAWYYLAVMDLAETGIVSGYEDGYFRPEAAVTRGELVTMALRFAGVPEDAGETGFTDVPKDHWAAGYIRAAVEKGHVTGYPDGSFKPDATITRGEAVTIINRVIGRQGISVGTVFCDVQSSHWAYEAITSAATDH